MKTNCNNNASVETEVLSAAVRTGDFTEVERLVASHREYMKRVVALRMDHRLHARLDPSDIVQEAQIEAVQRLNEYVGNPAMPMRLWLRKLACDAVVDAQRRHIHAHGRSVKREIQMQLPKDSSLSVAVQLIAGISTPSVQLSRKEVARLVHEAVDRLSHADREVVLLMAFEGLQSNEAAQVLGLHAPAVRKRYGRALLRLRTLLVEVGLGAS